MHSAVAQKWATAFFIGLSDSSKIQYIRKQNTLACSKSYSAMVSEQIPSHPLCLIFSRLKAGG